MSPQHLKDACANENSEHSARLLHSLSRFCSFVLHGSVPACFRHVFFAASLTPLAKKDGGIRPIAVGLTLRRLVCKIVSRRVMSAMFHPNQLGYGTKGGAECPVDLISLDRILPGMKRLKESKLQLLGAPLSTGVIAPIVDVKTEQLRLLWRPCLAGGIRSFDSLNIVPNRQRGLSIQREVQSASSVSGSLWWFRNSLRNGFGFSRLFGFRPFLHRAGFTNHQRTYCECRKHYWTLVRRIRYRSTSG